MSRAASKLRTASGVRPASRFDVDILKTNHGTRKLKPLAAPSTSLRQMAKTNQELAVKLSQLESERESLFERTLALQDHLISDQDLVAGLRSRISQLSKAPGTCLVSTVKTVVSKKRNYRINSENVVEFLREDPFLMKAFLSSSFGNQFKEVMSDVDPECIPSFLVTVSQQLLRLSRCFSAFSACGSAVQDLGFCMNVRNHLEGIFGGSDVTLFVRDMRAFDGAFRCLLGEKEVLSIITSTNSVMHDAVESQEVFIVNDFSPSDIKSLDYMVNNDYAPTLIIPMGPNALANVRSRTNTARFNVEDQAVGEFFSELFKPLIEEHLVFWDLLRVVAQRKALYTFESAIGTKMTFNELLPFVFSVLSDFCGANDAELFVAERDGFYTFDEAGGKLIEKHHAFTGVPKAILESKEPFMAEVFSPQTHPAFDEKVDSWSQNKSFIGIPVVYESQVIAVLCASGKLTSNRFDHWDLDFLKGLAESLSVVIPTCIEANNKAENDRELENLHEIPVILAATEIEKFEEITLKSVVAKIAELFSSDIVTVCQYCEDESVKPLVTSFRGDFTDKQLINDAFVYTTFDRPSPWMIPQLNLVPQFQPGHEIPMTRALVCHTNNISVMCFNCTTGEYNGLTLKAMTDLIVMILSSEKLRADIADNHNSDMTLRNVLNITATAIKNKEDPLKHLITMICDLINMSGAVLFVNNQSNECYDIVTKTNNFKNGSLPHTDLVVKEFRYTEKPGRIDKFASSVYSGSDIATLFQEYIDKLVFYSITDNHFVIFVGSSLTLNYAQLLGYFKPIIHTLLENHQTRICATKQPAPVDYSTTTLLDSDVSSKLFDVFRMSEREKMEALLKMFNNVDAINALGTNSGNLSKMLAQIREMYNDSLGFHNWNHAVDATQFVYSCLIRGRLRKHFSAIQMTAMLLAALMHDVQHEGLTTSYHTKARTALAYSFGDQSTMERFHASVAADFLLNSPVKSAIDDPVFWKFFVSCIVATDMVRHFEFVDAFKSIWEKFTSEDELHCLALAQFLVKCGNFANTTRTFEVARKFGLGLEQEYRNQAEKEKAVNLEITKFGDEEGMPIWEIEVSFYLGIVGPTLKLLGEFSPELNDFFIQMNDNKGQWDMYGREFQ